MRKIKFRAWHNAFDSMKKVEGLDFFNQDADLCNGNGIKNWYSFNNIVLMQYTGLKDKNGKEIYEGDILREGEIISEVIYEGCCFGLKEPIEGIYGGLPYYGDSVSRDHEIIGNIYENPALLKEV